MPRITSRNLRLTALAVAVLAAATSQAAVITVGSVSTGPAPVLLGPGDTALPDTVAWVGNAGVGNGIGSLDVNDGSFLSLARLSFGVNGMGNGTGLVTGPGTQLQLRGSGTGGQVQRLVVGDWGTGQLNVNGGALLSTRGIGPWTASYVAMRALGQPDEFLGTDVAMLRGLVAAGGPSTSREASVLAERWRPWRSYALHHLWSMA